MLGTTIGTDTNQSIFLSCKYHAKKNKNHSPKSSCHSLKTSRISQFTARGNWYSLSLAPFLHHFPPFYGPPKRTSNAHKIIHRGTKIGANGILSKICFPNILFMHKQPFITSIIGTRCTFSPNYFPILTFPLNYRFILISTTCQRSTDSNIMAQPWWRSRPPLEGPLRAERGGAERRRRKSASLGNRADRTHPLAVAVGRARN